MAEQVEKVKKVSRAIQSFQRILDKQYPQGMPPNKDYFDALMRQEKMAQPRDEMVKQVGEDPTVRPTLMDEVARSNKRVQRIGEYSSTDLISQTKEAVAQIDELTQKLSTPELKIKSSVQHLLKNKLSDINDNLKIAFSKAGIDYVPPDQQRAIGNPIQRFLDLLANGQHQLNTLSTHVEGLADQKEMLNPADLLALQLKVSHIQQELEFFTALLNKALESTKTLMNVQV